MAIIAIIASNVEVTAKPAREARHAQGGSNNNTTTTTNNNNNHNNNNNNNSY